VSRAARAEHRRCIARTSPPFPSFTPPKYRVTTATTSPRPELSSTFNIGRPAVPAGSPSSPAAAIDVLPGGPMT
jgi:hypothetical protein